CRHELPCRRDRLDVKENGARLVISPQMVEQVTEVDIRRIAQRDEMREADTSRLRPVEKCRGECAGLRHEGEMAWNRADVRKTRIEANAWHEQPDAVGTEDPKLMAACGPEHGARQRSAVGSSLLEPGTDHDRRARAA